jgi:predicted nucleic acid-binding protein
VRSLLLETESGTLNLAMCVVNLGELRYIIARTDSPAQTTALVEEIQGLSIEIVDANWKLTCQSAIFKSKGGFSYADCYTAALGLLRQAEVITGDPEFLKLREEITLSWVDSPRIEKGYALIKRDRPAPIERSRAWKPRRSQIPCTLTVLPPGLLSPAVSAEYVTCDAAAFGGIL